MLPLAQGRTAGRLRPLVDRAVIIADPEAADRRVKKALKGREVTHRPLKDQLSLIKAILPADGAVTVFTLIDLLAGKKVSGDDRLIGERRADAFSDLCKELLTHGLVDLRGLLGTSDDADEPEHFADLLDEDDVDQPAEDLSDIVDNQNGPVTSNADWYDDDLASDTEMEVGEYADDAVVDDKPDASASPAAQSEAEPTTDTKTSPAAQSEAEPTTDTKTSPAAQSEAEPTTDAGPAGQAGIRGDAETHAHSDAHPGTSTSPANTTQPAANAPVAEMGSPSSDSESPALKPSRPDDSRQLLRRQGRRPHLTLTMSMSTLLALDRLPGHLDGYGAITAELAEAIMDCAASLNLVIIDPDTGHPLHASGREYYRPRQQHRDIAGTMTETCRFPSCRQPVWKCDLDHREAYDHRHPEHGGKTDPCNLDPLCRRHHLMKHHSDWSPQRQPDGAMKWRSPTNHTYVDPPREITLPGELLLPTPNARTSIGIADSDHQSRCVAIGTEPEVEPGALSHSYAIRLAEREELHQRGLQRLANLRRLQNAEASRGGSGSIRQSTGARHPNNDYSNNKHPNNRHPNNNYPNNNYPNYEPSQNDLGDFDDHPAWSTANIPKTVAELRARSGFTAALADDDTPPF